MNLSRQLLCTLARTRRTRIISNGQPRLLNQRRDLSLAIVACNLSSYHVTKNIEFFGHGSQIHPINNTAKCHDEEKNRRLLVLLSWLMPKRKHIMKFVNLYVEQGFDIALVSITAWQLMWPVKGSRLVAADLLQFLSQNEHYQQILLHGFSVGGYMWGEVLDLIENDRQKYGMIVNRVVGQVWDSLADFDELPIGASRAVFPKNIMLQNMLRKYLEYHLKTFYNQSTQYYIQSRELFHATTIRAPALLFISKTDPVGTVTSNMRLCQQWESLGIETYMKVFEKSPHIGHYYKYPKEYVAEVYAFLTKLDLIQNEAKIMSRL